MRAWPMRDNMSRTMKIVFFRVVCVLGGLFRRKSGESSGTWLAIEVMGSPKDHEAESRHPAIVRRPWLGDGWLGNEPDSGLDARHGDERVCPDVFPPPMPVSFSRVVKRNPFHAGGGRQ